MELDDLLDFTHTTAIVRQGNGLVNDNAQDRNYSFGSYTAG